jgi:hypothetical protein
MQKYSVTPHPVDTLLTWVKSQEIAIPEIQRPFVWENTKVRDLLDSLYKGFPVGYLISWRNPTVKLKDGSHSAGKRILIDGQQRITALMAALLGYEVLTKDYAKIRIRIAFHPGTEKFEVANASTEKNPAWITDIATVFDDDASLVELTQQYVAANPSADERATSLTLEGLRKIRNNQIGLIELAEDLDIETVTEIFIRVNSAGSALSQADFAMSKIAVNEEYGGNELRKAIDYFCHLAVAPEFMPLLVQRDEKFASSDLFQKMKWLGAVKEDLYDPTYTDMLRVAFTSQFERGKLSDLVALLSGRNFETKEFEGEIVESSFARLRAGVVEFMNRTNYERMTMILKSAGFIVNQLIGSANAVNFAYVVFLYGRAQGVPAAELESIVRRWYVMSVLTGRYTGSPETRFDQDIRNIASHGLAVHADEVISAALPETFWTGLLPQQMETSSRQSPYFAVFLAAQAKAGAQGFLSSDINVQHLLVNAGDVHHVYPRDFLKGKDYPAARYNQIANLVMMQTEINIAISNSDPAVYFAELADQVSGGPPRYGGISDRQDLVDNLRMHCIPKALLAGDAVPYDDFLRERRTLMAQMIKEWFQAM